jgi:phage major head subunit gpT-like protein
MLAGSTAIFEKNVKIPAKEYWREIATVVPEDKQVGNYDTLGNLGPAKKHDEESAGSYDKIRYNNRTNITSYVWEKKVKVTLEANIFDQYGVVEKQFGAPLIKTLRDLKERNVAGVYNDMFTSTGADGVYYASASHPLLDSPKLNNNLMTGALSTDNIKKMQNMFHSIYNQAGELHGTRATHLLVNEDKQFQVFELLNSALMPWELSNTTNSLEMNGKIKVVLNPYLTIASTGADPVAPWFMLDMSLDKAGVIMQTKQGLKLRNWLEDDDLTLRGTAYEVYGVGQVASGYGVIASTGA